MKFSRTSHLHRGTLIGLFLSHLDDCLAEILHSGFISESVYDEHGFPVDHDHDDNEYPLTSTCTVRAISIPLCTSEILKQKVEGMIADLEKKWAAQLNTIEEMKFIKKMADEVHDRLQQLVKSHQANLSTLIFADLSQFDKAHLLAFIRVHQQTNLGEPCKLKLLNKGSMLVASQAKEIVCLLQ
jgi:hypothetical protein